MGHLLSDIKGFIKYILFLGGNIVSPVKKSSLKQNFYILNYMHCRIFKDNNNNKKIIYGFFSHAYCYFKSVPYSPAFTSFPFPISPVTISCILPFTFTYFLFYFPFIKTFHLFCTLTTVFLPSTSPIPSRHLPFSLPQSNFSPFPVSI